MPQTQHTNTPAGTGSPATAPSRHTSRAVAPTNAVACVWIADPPSWAMRRLEPRLRDTAVIVLEGRRVTGVCSRAHRAGVRVGDALVRARTLCPEAAVTQLEPSTLQAAWTSALEAMHRVTPWLESPRVGTAYLAGLTALDAEALAVELEGRVGMSAARGAALLAALAAPECGTRFVRDEAAFLSKVPVYLLRGAGIPGDVIARLGRFGLKTLGDLLARVTQQQLEAQFGKAVAAPLWSLVVGRSGQPVPVYTPPLSVTASWTFESPVLEPRDWQDVLERVVGEVVVGLGTRWAGAVTLTLVTPLGETSARQVLKQYTADAKTLLTCAERLLLEAQGGLEFECVTLTLSDLLKPIPFQESLFGTLERPHVRTAIRVVHQHYPDRIGVLEITRPDSPLRERRFRFKPLDGAEPRATVKGKAKDKDAAPTPATAKRSRGRKR